MTEINNSSDSDNNNNRSEYECNKKAEKIEYFILHGLDTSWTTIIFCRQCGLTFGLETKHNVYKLKGLFFCGPCFDTLERRHAEKGVFISLNAELYWDSLQSSPELQ